MSETTLPTELRLTAFLDGVPLPGAWFVVTLPMKRKNPYRLLFGPASSGGELTVSRDEMLSEIKKVRDLFLMDYGDPNLDSTGVLEARAIGRSDIAEIVMAYDTYSSTGIYPPNLSERLTELEVALGFHEGGEPTVTVTAIGGEGIAVQTSAHPAD